MTVQELHHKSMLHYETYKIDSEYGVNEITIHRHFTALVYEMAALLRLPSEGSEPTWSILHLSAASLAWQLNLHEIANELLDMGLTDETPATTRDDIEALRRKVR